MKEKELATIVVNSLPTVSMCSFVTLYSTHAEVCVYDKKGVRVSEVNLLKRSLVLMSEEERQKELLLLYFYLPYIVKAGYQYGGGGFVKI